MIRIPALIAVVVAVSIGLVASPGRSAEVQWFGQSALKITTPGGKVIVVDPFITGNPVTPEEHKDLAALGPVDVILVTHGHGDHVGDVAELAKISGAKVGVNADMGHTFRLLGMVPADQLIRFNKSGPIRPLGEEVTITMVHAEHSSEVLREDTLYPGGEPAGYIIEIDGDVTLYHAGDTGVFGDMRLIADLYDPDVAFLPIGGHFTMDPAHAAYAIENLLRTPTVMPIHYGTFPPLKGTPEELKAALGDSDIKVVVMQPGEVREF